MRMSDLADKARQIAAPYGIPVYEVAGWQTRGYEEGFNPDIALRHWTAGSAYGVKPSLGICTNGRHDLRGPLCNLFQERSSSGLDGIWVVASGKANHGGAGMWNGVSGNYKSVGLEIEWSGPSEAFSSNRKLVSEVAMFILMSYCGQNPNDACEHREYAPTRKIDTNLSGDELRRRMAEMASGPTPPIPEEEDMPVDIVAQVDMSQGGDGTWYVIGPWGARAIDDPAHANFMVVLGMVRKDIWTANGNAPMPIAPDAMNKFLASTISQDPHFGILPKTVVPKLDQILTQVGKPVAVDVDEKAIADAVIAGINASGVDISDSDIQKIADATVAEIAS
jgi:hypothetical protein